MLASANVILVMLAMMVVPVCVGVYVYRDAARRGMPPILWALVAVFVPYLLGLVVYLLVRGKHSDLECPRCGASVREDYTVCPKCGQRLHPACPNCGCRVEPDWKLCPKCATPLPEMQPDVQTPVRRKDRNLWKVVLIALLIPIILIGVTIAGFSVMNSSGGSSSVSMEVADYRETLRAADPSHAQEIENWLDDAIADPETIHALRFVEEGDPEKQVSFLVYLPNTGIDDTCHLLVSSSLFADSASLEVSGAGGSGRILWLGFSSRHIPKLHVEIRGQKQRCVIRDVGFNLFLF